MSNNFEMTESYSRLRLELKIKDIESVMRGQNWHKHMRLMADQFNTYSKEAKSESDVATKMDALILAFSQNVIEPSGNKGFELCKEHKVSIEKEVKTDEGVVRSTASGRIDSKYSSVVIEYKQPAAYKTKADTEKALFQAVEYLNSLYIEKAGTYLGIVTDGARCQFILFDEHAKAVFDADKNKVTPLTDVKPLDNIMVDKMIKSIINLQVKALTAENLIHDLVDTQKDGKNVIYHLTSALYTLELSRKVQSKNSQILSSR